MVTVILVALACGAIGYFVYDLIIDRIFVIIDDYKWFMVAFFAVGGAVAGLFLASYLGSLIPLGDEEIRGLSFRPTKTVSLCPVSSDGNVYVAITKRVFSEREEKREVIKIQFVERKEKELDHFRETDYVEENIIFLPEGSTDARIETVAPKRRDFWRYFTLYQPREFLFIPQNGIKEGKIKTLYSYEFIPNE